MRLSRRDISACVWKTKLIKRFSSSWAFLRAKIQMTNIWRISDLKWSLFLRYKDIPGKTWAIAKYVIGIRSNFLTFMLASVRRCQKFSSIPAAVLLISRHNQFYTRRLNHRENLDTDYKWIFSKFNNFLWIEWFLVIFPTTWTLSSLHCTQWCEIVQHDNVTHVSV